MRYLGWFLALGGLILATYFLFLFDTSVQTKSTEILGQTIGGDRVSNLGLIADKIGGIVYGMGLSLFGAVLATAPRTGVPAAPRKHAYED